MRKILFFLNIILILIFLEVLVAFAWNSPTNNPPNSAGQTLYVSSNGFLGISSSTPGYKLTVGGDIYSTGTVWANAFSGGTMTGTISAGNISSGQFGSNTGGGNYSFPGNVGIGTTTPNNTIQVANLINFPLNSSGTFLGYQAGNNNSGGSNTAVGYQALFSNNTGNYNTANGVNALFSNTTGNNNTVNGYNALFYNTTGTNNTANGYQALYSNTTGYDNTADGLQALFSNTTGYYNTADGTSALQNNTTGTNNTANGYQSLYSNTTGYSNTANGMVALYYNTTGYNNTANGVVALYYNTTGYYNTADGLYALFSNTTGYNNTALGYGADVSTGTLSNATAIGANATVGCSNCLVLGNGVNVGIGTASPANRLDVSSGNNSSAGIISLGGKTQSEGSTVQNVGTYNVGRSFIFSSWDDNINISTFDDTPNPNITIGIGNGAGGWSGNKYIHMDSSGNVGIGTTAPSYTLTVNGTAWVTSGAWSGSDIHWKKDITPLQDSLNKVLSLNPISFYWRKNEFPDMRFNDGRQLGFIAQEVQPIFPELVTGADGSMGLNYNGFVPVLTKAIQEQQSEIAISKSEIAISKSEIAELKLIVCHDHPLEKICNVPN